MKVNLQSKLFTNYSPMMSAADWKAKKAAEEAAKKRKEQEEAEAKAKEEAQKAIEELHKKIASIKTITMGTTPNFVIDLNPDLLTIDQIDQVTVIFAQNGKVVQKERLFHSDNYR